MNDWEDDDDGDEEPENQEFDELAEQEIYWQDLVIPENSDNLEREELDENDDDDWDDDLEGCVQSTNIIKEDQTDIDEIQRQYYGALDANMPVSPKSQV